MTPKEQAIDICDQVSNYVSNQESNYEKIQNY